MVFPNLPLWFPIFLPLGFLNCCIVLLFVICDLHFRATWPYVVRKHHRNNSSGQLRLAWSRYQHVLLISQQQPLVIRGSLYNAALSLWTGFTLAKNISGFTKPSHSIMKLTQSYTGAGFHTKMKQSTLNRNSMCTGETPKWNTTFCSAWFS